MNIERTKLIHQIHSRLASCEEQREELRAMNNQDEAIKHIDAEMKELRLKLQDIMNSICPVVFPK